jgi:hypothetical protein
MLEKVCTSFELNAGVIVEELTKEEKKEMFFEPCFSYFLLSLSFPFITEIIRILRLIRSLRDAKLVHSLSGL